jgi:hypothetical protein
VTTTVVLFILACVWAAVLLPPFLRNRSEARPADSITSFRRQLSVLERTTPGAHPAATPFLPYRRPHGARNAVVSPIAPVMTRREAQKRRRDILSGLLAAMVGSLILGFVPGMQVMLGLHLVLDVLFVAYVAVLVQVRRAADERELKVRFLPARANPSEPALLLRRSAN